MRLSWCGRQNFDVIALLAVVLSVACSNIAVALCPPKLAAQSTDIVRYQGQPIRQLGSQLFHFPDLSEELDLPAAFKKFETAPLRRSPNQNHFSGRYELAVYWIGLSIRNETDGPASLVPATNVPLLRSIAIYLVRHDCQIELLLNRSESAPYRPNDFHGQALTGRQFRLDAGEAANIIVRYGSYGMSLLPLSLETSETLAGVAAQNSVKNSVFYTFALATLIFFIGFNLALAGSKTALLTATFVAGLALLAQIDGLLFPVLWPDAPIWNRDASFYILTVVSVLSFITAASLSKQSVLGRFSQALLGAAAIPIVPVLLTPLLDIPTLTLAALAIGSLSVAAMAFATVMWARGGEIKRIIAIVAGVLAGFLMLAMVSAMIVGLDLLTFAGHDLARVAYLLISVSLMTAFTTHARGMSVDLREALQQRLVAAEREAEKNKALLEAERDFMRARDLAERRRAQLAEASHDLRQPIAALRLTVDSLPSETGGVGKTSLTQALDYVESILVENLERTDRSDANTDIVETGPSDEMGGSDPKTEREVFAAQIILDTANAMFAGEAKNKNLELRFLKSSLDLNSATTPVLRIVCNLVANAVKYTRDGKVIVGVLRRGQQAVFVVADTGPGIASFDRDRLFQPYEKTIDSKGHGLGLAIAKQLVDAQGLDLQMTTELGRGTCFRLTVPQAISNREDRGMGY